ncbi:MAG: glycosyltransferase family 4 protein [Lentisphaerae bacterium]|nr:glycosyltransferase family 4 protein [Lentisphaerota bacterium]
MKIVIDARWIFTQISGIGEYTRELIRQIAVMERRHDYTLLFQDATVMQRTIQELDLDAALNVHPHLVPYGVFAPRGQLDLPCELRRLGAHVYHSTNYMIPLRAFPRNRAGTIRCVVTIHDVIPLLFRDHAPQSRKARLFPIYRWLMREIGQRADRIITVSAASAADIARTLEIPADGAIKLCPIHNGVATRFSALARRPAKDATEERRILYVGRSDPYKNLPVLVEAFARVRPRLPFPCRLVVAGSPDPRYPQASECARRLAVDDHVQWTGYVSDHDLVTLYQNADLLVHPSRYEGFGLQIVEAMACGLPVVCSRAGALPEVAGDAALYAAPDDVDGFAAHILAVLTDPALAADLSRKGPPQAARYTWRATAEKTLLVYEDLSPP